VDVPAENEALPTLNPVCAGMGSVRTTVDASVSPLPFVASTV